MSSIGDRPARIVPTRVSETSIPSTSRPASANDDGQRQPDVTEADDGHATIGGHPAALLVPATPAGWLVGEPTRS